MLIHGGAGGVGHVAIQLARHAGARVCTTVGSDANARFVESLGAELAVNYREQPFVDAILDWTEGRGVDVALDIMGGPVFADTFRAMAHYGKLVTLLDPGSTVNWKEARNRNLCIGFELMLTPMLTDLPGARAHQGEILDRCAALCDAGQLNIEVSGTLPVGWPRRSKKIGKNSGSRPTPPTRGRGPWVSKARSAARAHAWSRLSARQGSVVGMPCASGSS